MKLAKSILVVIDPATRQQPALAQATVIAKKLKLELELLICNFDSNLIEHKDMLDPVLVNEKIDRYLQHYDTYLKELAKPLCDQGFRVNHTAVWDYPLYEGIIRQAMRSEPFMILKDTHYHNKLSRTIFNSADWNLIRACPYPLMLVKKNTLWRSPTVTCSVNPVDEEQNPCQSDKDILQFGKLLAHELSGKLGIYHSYYSIKELPQTVFGWGGEFNTIFSDEVDQQIRQSHLQTLYKLADEANVNHETITMEDGEAKYTLPEFVKKTNTDLLIMGTNCNSRFEQVLIGGTTESVLDDVECDVLVIHNKGFKTPVKKAYPALLR